MLHNDNLIKVQELIKQLENESDQNIINKIGDEYMPIAEFYTKRSSNVKNGKSVASFKLSKTRNVLTHMNCGEPLIHNKSVLLNNLKVLEMHIIDICENNFSTEENTRIPSTTNYNIYGNNNIINNGNIYSEAINKIDGLQMTDAEKEEIKNQIELIQTILESKDTKEKKWSKLKNIGKWIFDKSVDVGIALLPLLTKIN